MENPDGLPTYPLASIAVDFAGPDGQPFRVDHRSLDNALALPTNSTALLLISSSWFLEEPCGSSAPPIWSKNSYGFTLIVFGSSGIPVKTGHHFEVGLIIPIV
jgi:hypothetical protein